MKLQWKYKIHGVFSSLRYLLFDEQLLRQFNRISSMVTLDMDYCALKQQSLQLKAGAHKHNWPSFFPKIIIIIKKNQSCYNLTKNMSYLGQVLPDVTQNYQKRQRKRVIVSLPNNELGLLTKLQKKKTVTHIQLIQVPVYRLLLRKMSMLTCSGVRRERSLVTVSPAAEKQLL